MQGGAAGALGGQGRHLLYTTSMLPSLLLVQYTTNMLMRHTWAGMSWSAQPHMHGQGQLELCIMHQAKLCGSGSAAGLASWRAGGRTM